MSFSPALLQQLLPTQETRLLQLHTVLGQDALIAETLEVCAAIGPPAQSMPAPWQTQADAPVILPTRALGQPDQAQPGSEPAEGWASQRLLIVALSTDAHLSLKRLLGQAVQIDLRTQDGSFVRWGGSITGVEALGSDGALARYRLQVEPWLAFAAHRQDSRIYQDQSVPQIVDAILGSYQGQGALQVHWRWDLQEESVYPPRSLCTQYRESDLAFIHRLLREEGIFYWWEQNSEQEHPTLVLADHNGAIPSNHRACVRYSQTAAVLREDSLLRYSASAHLHSSQLQQASLDYRSLQQRLQRQDAAKPAASTSTHQDLSLAVIDQPGQYLWPDQAQGERLSQRQIQALNGWAAQSAAAGSWRDAVVGSSFTLTDHPIHTGLDEERDRFLILRTHHHVRNNLHADILADIERQLGPAPSSVLSLPNPQQHAELAPPEAGADSALQHSAIASAAQPLRNSQQALHWARLILQPASLPLRPEPLRDATGQPDIRLHGKPTAPGVQTALVVGLNQDPIHSDREGRIQIQYHWQRGSQSSPRQASPAHHEGDNAPGNARIGTWVRVLQTQAGSNWGSHYTPRLGQEVLVGYLHNDIDRPVVIGSLYNGQGQPEHASNQIAQGAAGSTGNAPAWFPGGSASNAANNANSTSTDTPTTEQAQWQNHRHDAILSGYKSQELSSSHSGNGGYNQLLIDSSTGQGRLELASSPDAAGRQATRLQLGHLLQQTDNRRQQSRGHGLDLYTPHWGAVRAGSGLLISSQAEPASHQSGQQLQSEQAQQELAQGQQLLQTLAADAQKHQAQATADEPAIRYPQASQQGPTDHDPTAPKLKERLPADADLQALRHSLAQTRSSQETDTATETSPQTIGGGHGTIGAWASPEILLASPQGIHSASSGQSLFTSAGSTSMIARQHINQMASAQYSLTSAQSIVLYTAGQAAKGQQPVQEKGIRLHAATGTVVVQAQNNRLEATAKQQVQIDSTHGSVKSGARGHQLLVAAGSAIEMKDGNITLLTKGSVSFKASQKVLTGPLRVSLPPLGFPSASCLPCLFKALESGSALAKVS